MDEREKLRQECHDDLAALRSEPIPERAYRLFERLVQRLDRLETGNFSTEERPTEPERRASSGHFAAVARELERGKALDEGKKE